MFGTGDHGCEIPQRMDVAGFSYTGGADFGVLDIDKVMKGVMAEERELLALCYCRSPFICHLKDIIFRHIDQPSDGGYVLGPESQRHAVIACDFMHECKVIVAVQFREP
jgi:hypothetical protein